MGDIRRIFRPLPNCVRAHGYRMAPLGSNRHSFVRSRRLGKKARSRAERGKGRESKPSGGQFVPFHSSEIYVKAMTDQGDGGPCQGKSWVVSHELKLLMWLVGAIELIML